MVVRELGARVESSRILFTLSERQLLDNDFRLQSKRQCNPCKNTPRYAREPGLHRRSEYHQEARESVRRESRGYDKTTHVDKRQGADQWLCVPTHADASETGNACSSQDVPTQMQKLFWECQVLQGSARTRTGQWRSLRKNKPTPRRARMRLDVPSVQELSKAPAIL